MFWLSLFLSLFICTPKSYLCGPSQNEPYHSYGCVCGGYFFKEKAKTSKSISFSRCKWTGSCNLVQGLVYIFSGGYWALFSILQPSLVTLCLEIIPLICLCLCFPLCALKNGPGCPAMFSLTGHSENIRDCAAISLSISSISSGVLASQIEICWLVSGWSLARHAQNDQLPAVCAALSTFQIKDFDTNVPTRQIFSIRISLDLFKSIQSPRMSRYRRSPCIYFSAALSFNILRNLCNLLKNMGNTVMCCLFVRSIHKAQVHAWSCVLSLFVYLNTKWALLWSA